MAYLPRRLSDTSNIFSGRDALGRRPVPACVERAVNRGVAVEHGRGIVRAAQVRAVEHVAEEALQAVGRLARTEAIYARHVPHAAARLQAIVDLAAMNLADIVELLCPHATAPQMSTHDHALVAEARGREAVASIGSRLGQAFAKMLCLSVGMLGRPLRCRGSAAEMFGRHTRIFRRDFTLLAPHSRRRFGDSPRRAISPRFGGGSLMGQVMGFFKKIRPCGCCVTLSNSYAGVRTLMRVM